MEKKGNKEAQAAAKKKNPRLRRRGIGADPELKTASADPLPGGGTGGGNYFPTEPSGSLRRRG